MKTRVWILLSGGINDETENGKIESVFIDSDDAIREQNRLQSMQSTTLFWIDEMELQ